MAFKIPPILVKLVPEVIGIISSVFKDKRKGGKLSAKRAMGIPIALLPFFTIIDFAVGNMDKFGITLGNFGVLALGVLCVLSGSYLLSSTKTVVKDSEVRS